MTKIMKKVLTIDCRRFIFNVSDISQIKSMNKNVIYKTRNKEEIRYITDDILVYQQKWD